MGYSYEQFTISQAIIDGYASLEQSDLGRNAVIVRGCLHFLAAPGEDGLVIDKNGHAVYRMSGEYMGWDQYSRRSGLSPM